MEKDRRSAVFSYNHSWDYVDLVLAWADAYATGTPPATVQQVGARDDRADDRPARGAALVVGPAATGPAAPTPPATAIAWRTRPDRGREPAPGPDHPRASGRAAAGVGRPHRGSRPGPEQQPAAGPEPGPRR